MNLKETVNESLYLLMRCILVIIPQYNLYRNPTYVNETLIIYNERMNNVRETLSFRMFNLNRPSVNEWQKRTEVNELDLVVRWVHKFGACSENRLRKLLSSYRGLEYIVYPDRESIEKAFVLLQRLEIYSLS